MNLSPDPAAAAAPLSDVGHVIQVAIAPVFLLTSVVSFLNLLSTRLGRVVDRTRVLLDRSANASEEKKVKISTELSYLARRRELINASITLGTVAAFLVCLLIGVAFVGSVLKFNSGPALAGLFVLAMLALSGALLLHLREVFVASRSTPFDYH